MISRVELLNVLNIKSDAEYDARSKYILSLGNVQPKTREEDMKLVLALSEFVRKPRLQRLQTEEQALFVVNVANNLKLWDCYWTYKGGYSTVVCNHSFIDGWEQAKTLLLIKNYSTSLDMFDQFLVLKISKMICGIN
jgi:hypothetical protein